MYRIDEHTEQQREMVVLTARGRVSNGGRRAALEAYLVSAGNSDHDFRVECVDRGGSGFRAVVEVPDAMARARGGARIAVDANQVQCALGDGTALACEGFWQDGRLRLDAVDQDNYCWFWLEVTATRRLVTVRG